MEFDMKWVHMARYGLILKQDRAIWLRIISKPLLTPKGAIKDPPQKKHTQKQKNKNMRGLCQDSVPHDS